MVPLIFWTPGFSHCTALSDRNVHSSDSKHSGKVFYGCTQLMTKIGDFCANLNKETMYAQKR